MSTEDKALEHAKAALQEIARIEDAYNGYLPTNIADFLDGIHIGLHNLIAALEHKVRS